MQALRPEERRPAWVWTGFAVIVLAAAALRWWLRRILERVVADRAPQGRIRRSLYGISRALLATLVPAAAAGALLLIVGRTVVGANLESIAWGAMGSLCLSAYMVGLGNALLLPDRPSWRLLAIPDAVARGLRGYPLILGVTVFVGWVLERLATFVQAGLPTAVAINAMVSLVLGLVLALALWRGERRRRLVEGNVPIGPAGAEHAQASAPIGTTVESHARVPRPWWLAALVAAVWIALFASFFGILIGYVALGGFVVRQLVWAAILVGSGAGRRRGDGVARAYRCTREGRRRARARHDGATGRAGGAGDRARLGGAAHHRVAVDPRVVAGAVR
jgi:potassium-dependent mechanosensitive channel